MNKQIWILIFLAIIIVVLLGFFVFMPKPVERPPTPAPIEVFNPQPNEEVSSPLKISGTVGGDGWSGFEGQVGTVKLMDYKGNELGSAVLTATTEWTKFPTSFETTLNFTAANDGSATLIFHNENPSGDPARDKAITMPIRIKANGDTMTVKVYWDSSTDGACGEAVYASNRVIPKTEALAKVALEELLRGPTPAEKSQGYATIIPVGSKLNSVSIVNGEARADFNETTESGGGSCSMTARVAQITQTLKQFSTITSVRLSIDGRTGDIFQP